MIAFHFVYVDRLNIIEFSWKKIRRVLCHAGNSIYLDYLHIFVVPPGKPDVISGEVFECVDGLRTVVRN